MISTQRLWRASLAGALVVGTVVATSAGPAQWASANPGTTVSGHAFDDINMNGVDDSEAPVAGIGVKVFDNTGALVGTGTTDVSGAYSVSVVGANTADVRVEFTPVRPWVVSFVGADSGGDIQFVTLPATNVNLGVQVPGEWCANNGGSPHLAVTRMSPNGHLQGIDGGYGTCNYGSVITMPWYTNQPYAATNEGRYGDTSLLLRHKNTGTTYGLAYDGGTSTIWTSAFIRRHSGLGPKGIGGLYVTSPAGGLLDSFDLAGAPWNLSLKDPSTDYSDTARGIDNNPAPPEGYGGHHSKDADAFSRVGKDGIGDIAIDTRASKLWLVNLYTKSLQRIGITGTSETPSLDSAVDTFNVPQIGDSGALCTTTGSVARPFGLYLNPRNQRPWVGVVCTNEAAAIPMANNNQDSAPPESAKVVELDPAGNAGAGSWSVVATVNLDYPHRNEGCGASQAVLPQPIVNGGYWGCWDVSWHAWTDSFTGLYDRLRLNGRLNPNDNLINVYYAQPILSGIAELGDGSIVVALTDRLNIQMGASDLVPIEPDATYNAHYEDNRVEGDILLLCKTGSTYTQENQGGCTSSGDPLSRTYQAALRPWAGAAQHLDAAEFFADNIKDFTKDTDPGFQHTELSNGALAVWPTSGDPANQQVAYTAMDPTSGIFESGIRWGSADDGEAVSGKTLAAGNPPQSFGKSANLGNLEAICDSAPVQVASRLWYDADQDGIQDPGEAPIAGATAHLYDSNGTLVGTAVTDASGNYTFSSNLTESNTGDSAGGGLEALKAFTIKFDHAADYEPAGVLRGLGPTPADATAPPDANGLAIDSNLVIQNGSFPSIAVPALLAGHNNHDLDAGVTDVVALTGTVWQDSNGNGVKDSFEPTLAGVLVELLDASGNPITGKSVTTDSTGAYSFDNLLPGTYKVRYTSPRGLYHFSDPAQGTDPLLDSDVVGAGPADTVGTTAPIVLTASVGGAMSANTGTDLNARFVNDQVTAGIIPPVVGVGNFVWVDLNKNGKQDVGEPGVPGAKIELRTPDLNSAAKDRDGNSVADQYTDDDGHYFIDDLLPGRYKMFITLPAGYEETPWTTLATGGDPFADSNANTGGGNYAADRFWSHVSSTFVISAFAAGDTPYNPANSQENYDGTVADTDPTTDAVLWNPSLDFGITSAGVAVGDTVWLDTNGNGIQDSGEQGLRGVAVSLVDENGSSVNDVDGDPVAPTTTDANGNYYFGGLEPGDYKVRFTLPTGVSFTAPLQGVDDTVDSDATPTQADPQIAESAVFTLSYTQTGNMITNQDANVRGGLIDLTLDAGIVPPIVGLGDLIWVDLNSNGVQDSGEPGVAGATVSLINVGVAYGDPLTAADDADGTPVAPVTTDANGHYFFDNLLPGVYFVRVLLPVGYTETPWTLRAAGGDPTADSTGFAFWTWRPGDDFFSVLSQLVYPVQVSALPYGNTPYNPADSQEDYDGTITDTDPLTKATLWNPTIDGGISPAGVAVGDTVWEDTDKDGIQDDGEPGLKDVTVDLVDENGDSVNNVAGNPVLSTTTDSNGHYYFGHLVPGDYKVRFTLPGGRVWTSSLQGADDTVDSDATPTQGDPDVAETAVFTLSYAPTGNMIPNQNRNVRGGMIDLTLDAGVLPPIVGVGNFVWYDLDRDGVQDAGEPGVPGATVQLTTENEWEQATDADGDPVAPVTTDANGHYEFDNLLPGRYRVRVILPSGWALTTWSSRYAGNDPLADSNAFEGTNVYDWGDYWNGFTDPFTVSGWPVGNTAYDPTCNCPWDYNGTVPETDALTTATLWNPSIDLGVHRLGLAVGNYVWWDNNKNGVQDDGEEGIDGMTVELLDENGNPANDQDGVPVGPTTTDSDGHYYFANLAPGDYKVRFTLPAGLTWTTALQGVDPTLDSDATPTQADAQIAESAVFSLAWDGADEGQVVNTDSNIPAQFINRTIDAGVVPPIVGVGNVVWWDLNKNGVQDAGEPGIAGAKVALLTDDSITQATDADGNPVTPVRTDANGHYFFDNLRPGRYDIKVTMPWGWRNSYWSAQYQGDDPLLDSNSYEGLDPFDYGDGMFNGHPDLFTVSGWPKGNTAYDPGCGCMKDYNGTIQETDPSTKATMWNPTIDFGLQRTGLAVGNYVWADANKNGIQDAGELGVADVTVELLDANGNSVNDQDGNPVGSTTTNSNGQYSFTNLAPGEYKVRFTLASGLLWTSPFEGASTTADSDAVPTLADPLVAESRPFSLAWDGLAAGEVANTDPNIRAQYVNPSLDAGVIGATGSNPTPTVVGVGDVVWFDLDKNGLQDPGEPGIAGVTAQLVDPNSGDVAMDADGNPVPPVTTDVNGRYFIDNLLPGQYRIQFTTAWGRNTAWTLRMAGNDPLADSNVYHERVPFDDPWYIGKTRRFNISATPVGDTPYDPGCNCPSDYNGTVVETDPLTKATLWNPTIDAGVELSTLGVGNRVWVDTNANGVQDAGEHGLPGATVNLVDANGDEALDAEGNPVGSTTTNARGFYAFGNLAPGDYKVRFTLPDGMSWTTSLAGADKAADSDATATLADPTIAESDVFTLSWDIASTREVINTDPDVNAQFIDPTVDAGVIGAEPVIVGVGDFVWSDVDKDGLQDPGEPGIAGVTAQLVDPNSGDVALDADGNPVPPVTTDANGHYFIDHLVPGQYRIQFTTAQGNSTTWTLRMSGNDPLGDSNVYHERVPFDDPWYIGKTRRFNISATPVGDTPYDPGCNCPSDYNGTVVETDPLTEATLWNPTVDAGVETAVIVGVGDYVWLDIDKDGVQDPGEPGIPGVKVQLFDPWSENVPTDASGNPVAPVTTDATGHYFIDNLLPGNYWLEFTPQRNEQNALWSGDFRGNNPLLDSNRIFGGYVLDFSVSASAVGETPYDPTCGCPWDYNGTVVETDPLTKATLWNPTIDGGIKPSALGVGDTVWNDTNSNGIQDPGEPTVQGVTVELLDAAGNTAIDLDGGAVEAQTTDATGQYLFTNLAPGTYRVRFTLADGMAWTSALQGADAAVDSDAVPTGDPSVAVSDPFALSFDIASTDEVFNPISSINAQYIKPSIDAGVTQPVVGVGDYVWLDVDKDGIQDVGEPAIPGASVQLYGDDGSTIASDADGNPVAPVTTDANGRYFVDNLLPGWYRVRITPPWGAANTPWTQRFAAADPLVDSNVYPGTLPYTSDWYIGRTRRFHIAASPVGDTPYSALCFCRWDYDATVDESDPSTEAVLWNPTIDGGVEPIGLAVGNVVWADSNKNGVQDVGELGVPGVTVDLVDQFGDPVTDLDGNPVLATTTDVAGNYVFSNLAPGTYKVRFTRPAGTQWTDVLQGSDAALDSDATPSADPATAESGTFTLAWDSMPAGQVINTDPSLAAQYINPTIDAGLVLRVAVGDVVWIDLDQDGIQDAGEAGLAGVTVELVDKDGNAVVDVDGTTVASQTTGANGSYLFDNVLPGDYRVRFTLPSGYRYTTAAAGADRTVDSNAVVDAIDTSVGLTPVFTVHPGVAGETVADTDLTTDALFVNPSVDAGAVPLVAVGDVVWADLDQDGVQDVGEPGLSGVTVELLDSLGNAAKDADGTTVASQTSGADGSYLFDNVLPGEYRVRFTLPSGYRYTTAATGADRTVDSNAVVDGVNPLLGLSPVFTVAAEATGLTVADVDVTTGALFVNPSVDAGAVPLVAVGDIVWVDRDQDGVQDVGEPGLAGVTVELLDSLGNAAKDADGTTVASQASGADGSYLFDGLLSGDYRVRFTLPAGLHFSPNNVGADATLDSDAVAEVLNPLVGQSAVFTVNTSEIGNTVVDSDALTNAVLVDPTTDAGVIVPLVAVGDVVWVDRDQDGIQDVGEPGLSGVTVELLDSLGNAAKDADGTTVASQTSGADGSYLFDGLLPGDYRVRFTLPSGYRYTTAAAGADRTVDSNAVADLVNPLLGLSPVFSVAAEATGLTVADANVATDALFVNPSVDVGVVPFVAVGDIVWVDRDQDGVQDAGEPGLAGVTVELLDSLGNAAKDADGTTMSSQTSGADGSYFFDGLLPGDYRVRFTLPSGYRYTTDGVGADATVDSNAVVDGLNPLLGLSPVFTAAAEVTGLTVADSDVATDALFVNPSVDAGVVPLVAVGDFVWVDADRDGVQDVGEPGLAGVTVELLDKDSNAAKDADGTTVASQTSGADGSYLFDNVLPGDYRVRFTLPSGYRYATAAAGSDRTVDSNAVADLVNPMLGLSPVFSVAAEATGLTVADSDVATDALFVNPSVDGGVVPLVAVGDVVWVDRDQDGVQDVGEPGLSGVTVELLDSLGNAAKDADGTTMSSQTSGADGSYLFDGLLPGEYRVRFTLPSGYRYTTATAGSDRTVDSNAVADGVNPLLGLSPAFAVAAEATGQTVADVDVSTTAVLVNPSVDAGVVPVVAAGDLVWVDRDLDGVQDVGEPGLAGVTVELLDSLGNAAKAADGTTVASQTTGADGAYFFDGLLPGDYRVRFTLPSGYRYTTAAVGADRTVDSNAVADLVNPLVGLSPVFTVAASETGQTSSDADVSTDALLTNSTIDAGVVPLVAVGDLVWVDLDQDGVQDVGEPGLAGVTVELLDSLGNAAKDVDGTTVASQTIGADGAYFFDGLLPGDYRVRFTLPAGYRYTTAAAGSDRTVDSNAVADLVNPLLGLSPAFTVAADATGQTIADVDVATGALLVNPSVDGGVVPLVAIGDGVWVDLDQDGVQDAGEPGLAGVTVELLDGNGDPIVAPSTPVGRLFGPVVGRSTVTGANGSYLFDGLLPGDYRVRFTLPSGYRYTTAAAGSDRTVDSNAVVDGANPLLGLSPAFTVAAEATGQTVADIDVATTAVLVNPSVDAGVVPLVAVGDIVWVDADRDGVQDVGESGLSGVTVELLDKDGNAATDAGGTTVASQTSGVDGSYFFDGLLPGDYRVRFTLPSGYRYTTAAAGADRAVDSNAVADGANPLLGLSPVFTAAAEATGLTVADANVATGAVLVNSSVDAGVVPLVGLASAVWIDADRDGVQDDGEPAMAAVVVELLDKDGNPAKDVDGTAVAPVTTGSDGRYFFGSLLPGQYRLRFTLPAGFTFTAPTAGSDGSKDSNVAPDPDDPQRGTTGTFTIAASVSGDTTADSDPTTGERFLNLTVGAGVVLVGDLPATGSDSSPITLLAALLALLGLSAIVVGRRRRLSSAR